jgi:hypothetical protein
MLLSSDVYLNGSLFIRPFLDYLKSLHSGSYACRAENAAGIVQTLPIQLKPRKSDNSQLCDSPFRQIAFLIHRFPFRLRATNFIIT